MTQENTKKRMTLRLPVELHNFLQAEANKKGISISALILNQLWRLPDGKKKET